MRTQKIRLPYPESVDLPFNNAAIRDFFQAGTPDGDDATLPGYWLLLRGDALLVDMENGAPVMPYGLFPAALEYGEPPFCIGLWRGQPLRVGRIAADAAIPAPWTAIPVNFREERLGEQLLTLAGMARQILHWKQRSVWCPTCSARLAVIGNTWGMRCESCAQEYYPPIHPAVIVLVRRGEEFLLARNAGWPAGQYALIAGYLEFGESLEECVCREVREETGIFVDTVRYVASQSWPFPSQIMAGFTAEYAGGELQVDTSELEDARWFRSDNPPLLSPRRSISRHIIDTFALKRP